MHGLLAAAASAFTLYSSPAGPTPRIEALTQRGPIYEMIVNCGNGTAIINYSPVERLYCAPVSGCTSDRNAVLQMSCGTGRGK